MLVQFKTIDSFQTDKHVYSVFTLNLKEKGVKPQWKQALFERTLVQATNTRLQSRGSNMIVSGVLQTASMDATTLMQQ